MTPFDSFRRTAGPATADDPPSPADEDGAPRVRPGWHRGAGRILTVLAAVLVLAALLIPDGEEPVRPAQFLRLPLEALVGVAVLLAVPLRARRVLAVLGGVLLALLAMKKMFDIGFWASLEKPFDPITDWTSVRDGLEFLGSTAGHGTATAVAVGAGVLALVLPVLLALAVLRLAGTASRHRTATRRACLALAVAWIACALGGVHAGGLPVADRITATAAAGTVRQVRASLHDRAEFADEIARDAYAATPGDKLLTQLRGKDVVLVFVESYGRSAVLDSQMAPGVGAVLDGGTGRLAEAGFGARSAFLTSATFGGGSWLGHSTFLSGTWVSNQQRYRDLIESRRFTLTKAFRRAGWRTVDVAPGVTRDWPEGDFYGYDTIYAEQDLGYRGKPFAWATMPDQYTLKAFHDLEHGRPGHAPLMAQLTLVSSHAPWSPLPRTVPWDQVGDGSVFATDAARFGEHPTTIWQNPSRVREQYGLSVQYSLTSLISYLETYGDDDLVTIFLGDHQPASVVTGENAGRDVPITIVAKDPEVLDRITGWGWQEGLRPGPQAPVWRMSDFRDRFLAAYS